MKKRHSIKPFRTMLSKEQEQNITRYFEKAEEGEVFNASGSQFAEEHVYDRILHTLESTNRAARFRRTFAYAASVFLALGVISALVYDHLSFPAQKELVVLKQQAVQNGNIVKMQLPDGTTVWINAGSKLHYPAAFSSEKREVTLEGEAYFQVKHEASRPFLIHTQNVITQVLGTSFNIRSYADSKQIKVTVLSGKVAVYEAGKLSVKQKPVMLTSDQEVVYSKRTGKFTNMPKQVQSADAAAWKDGNLVFKNTELSEITGQLERKYNIQITLDKKLPDCRVTVNFNNEPLEHVLSILPRLVGGKLTPKAGGYVLSGAGCQ